MKQTQIDVIAARYWSHSRPITVAYLGFWRLGAEIMKCDESASPIKQESCPIAKMTAQCDKSKQTATPPPKIT